MALTSAGVAAGLLYVAAHIAADLRRLRRPAVARVITDLLVDEARP